MALVFTHGTTSRKLLEIDWDFPASLELVPSEHTRSTRMYALSRDVAFERITAADPRPLLIVRECSYCKGTDDALLSRKLNNERTKLLARWFHCVKFKPNVMRASHTFRRLFSGEHPPHLLIATADAATIVPLDGRQSQTKLWKSMRRVLKLAYCGDPEKAVREIFRLMTRYDHYDSMLDLVHEQIEVEIEAKGPRSRKLRKLRRKEAELQAAMQRTRDRQRTVEDLGLRELARTASK